MAYIKQFATKQRRSGLVEFSVQTSDPHNFSIIVLAPLMWYLQSSRPESMSSYSMNRSTTARTTSVCGELVPTRADCSKDRARCLATRASRYASGLRSVVEFEHAGAVRLQSLNVDAGLSR